MKIPSKSIIKYFITISILALFISSCTTNKQKALKHSDKAKELYLKGDLKTAFDEIDTAIKIDNTNLDFLIIKSDFFAFADNYEPAIDILNTISKKNFKLDTVNFKLGTCYFGYGNFFSVNKNNEVKAEEAYKKALVYYNKAIGFNMHYYNAYLEKQHVFHNLNQYNEAISIVNTAINLFPDSLTLIFNRGVEKIYLGDFTGALIDLNTAIESNKLDSEDVSTAYRFRGNLYFEQRNIDKAIIDLNTALSFNPKDEFALAKRGNCYREKGLKEKACEDFRKAADLGLISEYEIIKEYCNN
jgi:tetratricopeptide (TPR) repeat protein